MLEPQTYEGLAERAWRWVLDQVRWDDGPWIPETVTQSETVTPPARRDGVHSGVGGLAHVLAEIRVSRSWTTEESSLAEGIGQRVRDGIPAATDYDYFDGLVSGIGVLTALGADGVADAVDRLAILATPDGWPQTVLGPPRFLSGTRIHDLTLGTAGVVVGGLWAQRHGVDGGGGGELARQAADIALAEAEPAETGTGWRWVPARFRSEPGGEMPNLSHGTAGIALALALAGAELHRPDLVEAARSGAEHLVSLGERDGEGFVVPKYLPRDLNDEDRVTYTWCHGGSGTSLLFLALQHAGVAEVAGDPPLRWHRRLLHSVRTSGLPDRLHPGFWDNDGRCCGTAGVGEVFLDSWQRAGDPGDLAFARHLADALVERARGEGAHAYWRFVEHRAPEPLLPPGVGWMQGAAGIAAYLFRIARVLRQGADATVVPRMDTWFALPS